MEAGNVSKHTHKKQKHILFSTVLSLKLPQLWRHLNKNYVYACPSIRQSALPSYLIYTIYKRTEKAGIQKVQKLILYVKI
jgi:hypothetical protein